MYISDEERAKWMLDPYMREHTINNDYFSGLVKQFEFCVYDRTIKPIIEPSNIRSFSGWFTQRHTPYIRTYYMAGRNMVTLLDAETDKDAKVSFSMVFADGERPSRGGMQSYEGSRLDALTLLVQAIENPDLMLTPDTGVSIGFTPRIDVPTEGSTKEQ